MGLGFGTLAFVSLLSTLRPFASLERLLDPQVDQRDSRVELLPTAVDKPRAAAAVFTARVPAVPVPIGVARAAHCYLVGIGVVTRPSTTIATAS